MAPDGLMCHICKTNLKYKDLGEHLDRQLHSGVAIPTIVKVKRSRIGPDRKAEWNNAVVTLMKYENAPARGRPSSCPVCRNDGFKDLIDHIKDAHLFPKDETIESLERDYEERTSGKVPSRDSSLSPPGDEHDHNVLHHQLQYQDLGYSGTRTLKSPSDQELKPRKRKLNLQRYKVNGLDNGLGKSSGEDSTLFIDGEASEPQSRSSTSEPEAHSSGDEAATDDSKREVDSKYFERPDTIQGKRATYLDQAPETSYQLPTCVPTDYTYDEPAMQNPKRRKQDGSASQDEGVADPGAALTELLNDAVQNSEVFQDAALRLENLDYRQQQLFEEFVMQIGELKQKTQHQAPHVSVQVPLLAPALFVLGVAVGAAIASSYG